MKWIIGLILIFVIIPLANAHETPFGYQFLDNNQVFNMWNPSLNYYFNTSSGLQFTNNYNDYWSKNIFCISWKSGTNWIDRCNDGTILRNFEWTFETDNLTYVTAQGYKNITFDGKMAEIGLNYTLNTIKNDLTITPSLRNIDTTPITDEIRFKWRVQDINIGDGFNNFAIGDGVEINLSKNWDVSRTNITPKEFMIYKLDSGKWFKISWDYGQNNITVKSESGQYNAPITLILNDTGLNVGQKKQTNLYWIDALCTINAGTSTPIEQQKLINGDDIRFISFCDQANTGCPGTSGNCQPKLEVGTRKDGLSSFSLLTSGDAQDYVCNNFVGANYQFAQNNMTDIRGCFRVYIDVLGICQPSANCFSTNVINDVWLNNHTPITSNASLTIFNDTYVYTDGVNQYVNISSTANPNFVDFLKQNFTISLWIKINDTDTSSIISQQDGAGTGRTILVNRPGACGTHLGSNIKGVNTCFIETLSVQTWYNPVLTYNGTTLGLYLNGVYSNSSVLNPNENANGNIILGANKNLAQLYNGSIDNLIYYNRTLNSDEILDLYNKGRISNPAINQTTLLNWFRFDEGNGIVSYDYITNGYANLTNGITWFNLGSNSTFCNYSYYDGDNDLENTSITIFKWFFQGKILESQYNNLTYINNNGNQYICCVKSFDDVFITGTENFSCSGDLNKDVIFALIISYTAISIFLLLLCYRIKNKHPILSLALLFLGLYTLLYNFSIFNYFISSGYFKAFYLTLFYSYWLIAGFTFIIITIGIIKKLGGKP